VECALERFRLDGPSMAIRPHGFLRHPVARRVSRSGTPARPLSFLRAATWLLAALATASTGMAQEMEPASFAHTQAVRMARRGQVRDGLHVLRLLHAANPEDQRMLGDYVAVLGWVERDEEVVELAGKVDLDTASDYAVETIGRSLRNLGRYDEAAEVFRSASSRFPEHTGLRLQLALCRAESGELQAALPPLVALLEDEPDNLDVLLGAGLVRRWRGEYLDAIELCDRALSVAPEHEGAYRLRVLSISDLGAAQKAFSDALRRPELFSDEELERFRMDRATTVVRWGALPAPRPALQHAESERAVGLVSEVLLATSSPSMRERARFDRIVALRNRKRPADAVAEYEAYLRENENVQPLDVPPWVLVPVAESYAALGRSGEAIPLFEHARSLLRTRSSERHHAGLGLFLAHLNTDDFDAAHEVIEEIRAEEPAWRWKPDGKEALTNPRRLEADIAALAWFTWADRLSEAQETIEKAVDRAPMNVDLRRELATVLLARGWPEHAWDEARTILGIQPDHVGAHDLIARAQMDLREWGAARASIDAMAASGVPVDALRETWDLKRAWELRGELAYGENDGTSGFFGGENALAEMTLFSAPLADRVRLFGHAAYGWASYVEGDASLLRGGVGAEYADRHWRARTELHVDSTRELDSAGNRDTRNLGGIGALVELRPDDRWTFETRYDSISLEMPLRGRQQGIEGELFGLSAVHRFSDEASLRAGVAAIDMTDGNDREYAFLSGRKRVVTQPHYKLMLQPELYASRNSRGG